MLRVYVESDLKSFFDNNTMKSLLFVFKLKKSNVKKNLFLMTTRLLSNSINLHVRVEIAHQLNVMFRFKKRISNSKRVITKFFKNHDLNSNHEFYYFFDFLHLFQINNKAYRFDFCKTREKICK